MAKKTGYYWMQGLLQSKPEIGFYNSETNKYQIIGNEIYFDALDSNFKSECLAIHTLEVGELPIPNDSFSLPSDVEAGDFYDKVRKNFDSIETELKIKDVFGRGFWACFGWLRSMELGNES